MELTQEYLNKQFEELHKRLDNMATKAELEAIRSEMATKKELESIRSEMVTKADLATALQNQTQQLEDYTDSVAQTILEAVDSGFKGVKEELSKRDKRLDTVEKDVRRLKGALNLS